MFLLRGLLVATLTVMACVCLDVWGYHILRERNCDPHSSDSNQDSGGVCDLGTLFGLQGETATSWSWSWQSVPIPPLNFIWVNFVEDMSARFGVQPWHWHITQVRLPTDCLLLCSN